MATCPAAPKPYRPEARPRGRGRQPGERERAKADDAGAQQGGSGPVVETGGQRVDELRARPDDLGEAAVHGPAGELGSLAQVLAARPAEPTHAAGPVQPGHPHPGAGRHPVTPGPSATTSPTTWWPGTIGVRRGGRSPSTTCRSVRQMPQARTCTSTSPGPGTGGSTSSRRRGRARWGPAGAVGGRARSMFSPGRGRGPSPGSRWLGGRAGRSGRRRSHNIRAGRATMAASRQATSPRMARAPKPCRARFRAASSEP